MAAEIKGERLRFVDAMKEATSIHVQSESIERHSSMNLLLMRSPKAHVDQLRKELTREAAGMSQEVARLQREREVLERQLAELRAFHARQQQAAQVSPPAPRFKL